MLCPLRFCDRNSRRGVAAVELAVLSPFLAYLFVIAIDYGRVFYYSQTIQNCAHSGAMYASGIAARNPAVSREQAARDAALAEGGLLNPPLAESQVNVETIVDPDPLYKNAYKVTITYTFTTVTGFPGIPSSVTLTRSSTMRIAPP